MRQLSLLSASVLVLGVLATLMLINSPAHADTYRIYNIGRGNSESSYGLTDSGVAVLQGGEHCTGLTIPTCYS